MEEVSRHSGFNDAWMVIYDRVYDFSTFLSEVSLIMLRPQNCLKINKTDASSHVCGRY